MACPEFIADRWVGMVGISLFLAAATWGTLLSTLTSAALLLFLPALAVIFRTEPIEKAAQRLTVSWGGAVYLGGTAFFAIPLLENTDWLFTMCITVWGADSGAYFAGRLFGRTKLHKDVSPNKTVEGLLGGLATSVGAAAVLHQTLLADANIGLASCLIAGAVSGLLGPLGDLIESALKRAYNVKDSGKLLPGHGGFLDRLDALLFAMPFFALYGLHLGLVQM